MTTKKTKPEKYHVEHAPLLVYLMCKANQDGLTPGEWIALAAKPRHAELRAAIEAYAPGVLRSPGKFAFALKAICNVRFDYADEVLMLRSKYINRRHQTRYGAAGTLLNRIRKQRAIANAREFEIQQTARTIAEQLRRNKPLTLPAVAPSTPVLRSASDEARELGIATGWDRPPTVARTTAPAPVQLEEPPPAPVDMTGWPPAWRKHGKPTYHTPTHEAPNEHYLNAEACRHYGKGDGPELASYVFDDRNPRNWPKKETE